MQRILEKTRTQHSLKVANYYNTVADNYYLLEQGRIHII